MFNGNFLVQDVGNQRPVKIPKKAAPFPGIIGIVKKPFKSADAFKIGSGKLNWVVAKIA